MKSMTDGQYLKVGTLVKEKRRASVQDPNDIFNQILGATENLKNCIKNQKEKAESKMVSKANPSMEVEDWDNEIAEIHKYVEHKKDVLRSECYYWTKNGKIKGMLTIKDGIIVFDPLRCEENNKYDWLSKYNWFIDLKDLCDAQIIKLPNESAMYITNEKDRQWYIYDYYLQLSLSTVDGETFERLLAITDNQEIRRLTKSRSAKAGDLEFDEALDNLGERKGSDQNAGERCRLKHDLDNKIFHQLSKDPAIAVTFFRFSHRDKNNNPLTNKQQESIVDNIYQNLFYLAETMKPHRFSSTKVPFFDELVPGTLKKEKESKSTKPASRDEDSITEDKQEMLKLPSKAVSLSVPTFTPFKKGEESQIISETQAIMISRLLPSIIRMREWERLFATDTDGISLNTFYKNMYDHTATIMIIQDSNGYKFGCFASWDWETKKHFYGTGESFLFTFHNSEEDLKYFKWTGKNDNIQYSDRDSLAMGGDRGKHALYIRNHFYSGSSHRWSTFDNDILSSEEDYEIAKFEVWGFDWY